MQLGHIGLNVTDAEVSRDFFVAALGLEVMHESGEADRRCVFLGRGGEVSLTLWQQSAGRWLANQPGLHHLAWQVEDMDEVRAVEARLRAMGATLLRDGIVPHSEGGDSGGIFFEAPDGLRIEVFAAQGAGEFAAPTPGHSSCGFF